jgi:hypothetical protein
MNDDPTSAAPQGAKPADLPLTPRSRLVSDFFDHMNRQDLAWVVMNNYNELPWVIPSDIDFSIPPALFQRLDGFIAGFAAAAGATIVQKLWHGNMKCAYILATGPGPGREFVQLDFFTAFSTKGCPALIPHEELVAERRALRNFHVPRPGTELIFTVMRRLFKNDWSPRHCARIAELHAAAPGFDWLPERYYWLRPTLQAAAAGDVATVVQRRGDDWARLRATARRHLGWRDGIANAALQTRRIAARLRDETGQLIVLAAPRDSIGSAALDRLELVFHRRLFLDGPAGLLLPGRLALLKRRKGLIFVLAGAEQPQGRTLARRLARLGLADQLILRANDSAECLPDSLPTTTATSDVEVIEAILTVQAAKTAAAMERGGTQTSGAQG